jgi:hypothetical protein
MQQAALHTPRYVRLSSTTRFQLNEPPEFDVSCGQEASNVHTTVLLQKSQQGFEAYLIPRCTMNILLIRHWGILAWLPLLRLHSINSLRSTHPVLAMRRTSTVQSHPKLPTHAARSARTHDYCKILHLSIHQDASGRALNAIGIQGRVASSTHLGTFEHSISCLYLDLIWLAQLDFRLENSTPISSERTSEEATGLAVYVR